MIETDNQLAHAFHSALTRKSQASFPTAQRFHERQAREVIRRARNANALVTIPNIGDSRPQQSWNDVELLCQESRYITRDNREIKLVANRSNEHNEILQVQMVEPSSSKLLSDVLFNKDGRPFVFQEHKDLRDREYGDPLMWVEIYFDEEGVVSDIEYLDALSRNRGKSTYKPFPENQLPFDHSRQLAQVVL